VKKGVSGVGGAVSQRGGGHSIGPEPLPRTRRAPTGPALPPKGSLTVDVPLGGKGPRALSREGAQGGGEEGAGPGGEEGGPGARSGQEGPHTSGAVHDVRKTASALVGRGVKGA
jgi:hypothetical protein